MEAADSVEGRGRARLPTAVPHSWAARAPACLGSLRPLVDSTRTAEPLQPVQGVPGGPKKERKSPGRFGALGPPASTPAARQGSLVSQPPVSPSHFARDPWPQAASLPRLSQPRPHHFRPPKAAPPAKPTPPALQKVAPRPQAPAGAPAGAAGEGEVARSLPGGRPACTLALGPLTSRWEVRPVAQGPWGSRQPTAGSSRLQRCVTLPLGCVTGFLLPPK